MMVCSDVELTELSTEHVYVPTTSDGCNKIIRILSYLAVTPSLTYWVVTIVSLSATASPFLNHVTFVGGDPDDEQFKVKTVTELSWSEKILTGTAQKNVHCQSFFPKQDYKS